VAILNSEHLFEQADYLIISHPGRPRQVDVRRAISAAYYGLFHAVVTAAADQVVGSTNRTQSRYGLVYRSIDHKSLREFCKDIQKSTLPDKYKPYAPQGGFGSDIVRFAAAIVQLQEKRHAADYDPMVTVTQSDAILLIAASRAALSGFQNATPDQRTIFLTMLLFPPRSSG
jgi:hypothetical protein